jgi:hypothetical protein
VNGQVVAVRSFDDPPVVDIFVSIAGNLKKREMEDYEK